jgi:hypothetical protein
MPDHRATFTMRNDSPAFAPGFTRSWGWSMARRPDTPCASCGRLLWSGRGALPAGQRICRACRKQHGIPTSPGRPSTRIEITCQRCGTMFEGRPERKYCSQACGHAAHRPARKPSRTTTQRGYGWQHQKARAAAIARFVDGDPCARCGQPMHGDPRALQLDHSDDRTGYRGLAHAVCNLRAGARKGNAMRSGPPARTATSRW